MKGTEWSVFLQKKWVSSNMAASVISWQVSWAETLHQSSQSWPTSKGHALTPSFKIVYIICANSMINSWKYVMAFDFALSPQEQQCSVSGCCWENFIGGANLQNQLVQKIIHSSRCPAQTGQDLSVKCLVWRMLLVLYVFLMAVNQIVQEKLKNLVFELWPADLWQH